MYRRILVNGGEATAPDVVSGPIRVLLVEDNPGDADLIRESLAEVRSVQTAVTHVERLDSAAIALHGAAFDVVLLDLSLPDSQGLETVQRTYEATSDTPIVVLTGADDEVLGMEAVRLGAQDYLVKGQTTGRALVRAIRYATERKRVLAELEQARNDLEQRVRERTADLEHTLVALQTEFDDRMQAEYALRESELKFRQMAEAIKQVFWMGLPDLSRTLYVNPAYERLWGRSCESLYDDMRSTLEAIHPSDRHVVDDFLEAFNRGGPGVESWERQFRVIRPDTTTIKVLARAFPVRDERGSVYRVTMLIDQLEDTPI